MNEEGLPEASEGDAGFSAFLVALAAAPLPEREFAAGVEIAHLELLARGSKHRGLGRVEVLWAGSAGSDVVAVSTAARVSPVQPREVALAPTVCLRQAWIAWGSGFSWRKFGRRRSCRGCA